jgi:hypothetical protein
MHTGITDNLNDTVTDAGLRPAPKSILPGGFSMMRTKSFLCLTFVLTAVCLVEIPPSKGEVIREGGKTYIVDRTGYRWDVTQAVSLGFKPEGFQFGIGKNAFTTLDNTDLAEDGYSLSGSERVIGLAEGGEAQAYAVSKLTSHEIANTTITSKPVAVGY